jgi:hypothetical protein
MSQIVEFLYPLPDIRRTPVSLLRWWESRRLSYNAIVGATGLTTLAVVKLLFLLPPGGSSDSLAGVLPVLLTYGVIANLAYTGGWLTELALQRFLGRSSPQSGPALFRLGLSFSVGLTLFPAALAGLGWIVRLVRHLLG